MDIKFGNGSTKFGPGVSIDMSGDEVALAITAWLVGQGIHISGPRTVRVNGGLCADGHVYVDPSGFVIADGAHFSGRGPVTP